MKSYLAYRLVSLVESATYPSRGTGHTMDSIQPHDKNLWNRLWSYSIWAVQTERLRSAPEKNLHYYQDRLDIDANPLFFSFARQSCLGWISVEGSGDPVSSGAQSLPPCIPHAWTCLSKQTSDVISHLRSPQQDQEAEGCSLKRTVWEMMCKMRQCPDTWGLLRSHPQLASSCVSHPPKSKSMNDWKAPRQAYPPLLLLELHTACALLVTCSIAQNTLMGFWVHGAGKWGHREPSWQKPLRKLKMLHALIQAPAIPRPSYRTLNRSFSSLSASVLHW